MGVELERWSGARRSQRARRAHRPHSRSPAVGVGAARAGAAGAAAAPSLALVLQVVWGRRDERPPLPAIDALARRVRLVRLAGGRLAGRARAAPARGARRHAPARAACALPLLPAHCACSPRRRKDLPLTRPTRRVDQFYIVDAWIGTSSRSTERTDASRSHRVHLYLITRLDAVLSNCIVSKFGSNKNWP